MVKNFRTKPSYEDYKNPSKNKTSLVVLLIVLITVAFVAFVAYMKLDSIKSFIFGEDIQNVNGVDLKIWQTISITWTIVADWDLVTHTHTIQTQNYWKIGLISKDVDLWFYQWEVAIQWTIDKFQSWLPILQVEKISTIWNTDLNSWVDQKIPWWMYIQSAWIYFPVQFFEKYVLLEQSKADEIQVKNIETNQTIKISYFECKKWNVNQDCKTLEDTNSKSAEKSFTTSNGNSFYKFSEVESRFATNQNRWYYVDWALEKDVIEFSQYMVYPDSEWIITNVVPNIKSLCIQNDIYMDQVDWYNSLKEEWFLVMYVSWSKQTVLPDSSTQTSLVSCKLQIDPSLNNWASLLSLTSNAITPLINQETWTIVNTWSIEVNTWENIDSDMGSQEVIDNNDSNAVQELDLNVTQFPINLNKKMEFKWSKWYTIIFPASNITRRPGTIEDKTLWQVWVSCFAQYNVTKYSKEDPEIATTSPSIKIYECRIKWDISWTNKYVNKVTESDRKFVIEIIDPSWKNFSDTIEVVDQTWSIE